MGAKRLAISEKLASSKCLPGFGEAGRSNVGAGNDELRVLVK